MKLKIFLMIFLVTSIIFAQGRRGGRNMTWDESLNLTTEQMQQITELRDAMQPAMMEIRQNTRTLEIELRQLTSSEEPDAERIAELETTISDYQTAIDQLMSSHHELIRSLLTEDQQLIYDQLNFGPNGDRGSRMGNSLNRGSGRGGNRMGRGRW